MSYNQIHRSMAGVTVVSLEDLQYVLYFKGKKLNEKLNNLQFNQNLNWRYLEKIRYVLY